MGNSNPFIFKARKNIAWVQDKQAINFRLEPQQSCLLTVAQTQAVRIESLSRHETRKRKSSSLQPGAAKFPGADPVSLLNPAFSRVPASESDKEVKKTAVIAKNISYTRRKGSSWKPELVKFSEPDREKEQISLRFCCLYLSVWSWETQMGL